MTALRNLHPAWFAGIIGLAVLVWLASGMYDEPQAQHADADGAVTQDDAVSVQVSRSQAADVERSATVSGRTAPVRSVTLRAQTSGRVREVAAQRGAMLEADAVIARLALDDRRAQLRQAEAMAEQRSLQFKAAQEMQTQGYQTDVDLAEARANRESAKAQVEAVRKDITHTEIRAPFAGILETRPVESGDFVNVGDSIGRVIDQDPFIVRGTVSEDVVGFLETGQSGSATLIDGSRRSGTLRYVASDADEETRTYLVELEVPNPEGRLISGASAELRLPLETVRAHEVAASILTLDEAGVFGIKSVDDDDRVRFHAADIVRNEGGRVWLAGLPDQLRIIQVGQGFVTAGERVRVEPAGNGGDAAQSGSANSDASPEPRT